MAKIQDDRRTSDHAERGLWLSMTAVILIFLSLLIAFWAALTVRVTGHIRWFPGIVPILALVMVPSLLLVFSLRRYLRKGLEMQRKDHSMIRQMDERISYYQGINDSNQSGYLVFDKVHFHIIDTNSIAPVILGGTHQSLIGSDIRELFGDISWPEGELPFRQSEIQVQVDSGPKLFILATLANLDLPPQDLAVMSFVDITQRMKIEQALHESRSRFHTLFHGVPIGLYQSTADGLFLEANKTLADILGYPDIPTLLTTRTQDLYEKVEDRADMISSLSTSHDIVVKEARLRRYDGKSIWARITAHSTLDDHSGIRYLEGAIQDITDQKAQEIEADTMERMDSRHRRMDTVGILAGGVAHEFNNILTGMKLRLQVCRVKDINNSNQPDLDYFEGAVDRAATHVEGLLAAAGEPLTNAIVIDINEIVTTGIDKARKAHSDHITWLDYHSSEPLGVMANPQQVAFILEELIKNAVSAIEDDGKITVLCTKKTPGRIMSGILPLYDEPHAAIIVQDTGLGMSPETVDRVFEPYFTTQEFGKGGGLGLTKVYGIIRQHQGGIVLNSKQGVGTTVMVFLPLTN